MFFFNLFYIVFEYMKNNTLIFIDWDDTLFPTTWYIKNKLNIKSNNQNNLSKYIEFFKELDITLLDFLQNNSKFGKIIIVTNASMAWINKSMLVLPKSSIFIKKNIKVVSARDSFGKYKNIYLWKQYAFENEVDSFFKNIKSIHNLISIGDADYEHTALIKFDNWEKNKPQQRCLKTIKFASSPSFMAVEEQIKMLNKVLPKVIKKTKHYDLTFKKLN